MFSEDPLVPHMCLIFFLFLEVTPVIGVIWDASLLLLLSRAVCGVSWQPTVMNCEGLKVVGYGFICDLL